MGLFSFNYSKPGPGIDKDAPQKKGIFRYFDIFMRKFWKLIQINLIYFICSLPMLFIMYMIAPFSSDLVSSLAEGLSSDALATIHLTLRSFFAVMLLALWGSGPASAAYAYITRCFTREQHAWIFSDFKDKFIENFKQSIIVAIIDIVALLLIMNSIYFYFMTYKSSGNQLWLLACCVMCTIFLIYTFMHFYIYQFMVTFTSKLSQLYKNAVVFSIAQLPYCVLFTALAVAVNFVMFTYLNPLFALIIDLILGYSLVRFPIEYHAARAIEKKLLPYAAEPAKIEYEDDNKGEE